MSKWHRHQPITHEAFWERIDKSGGEEVCWPWLAGRKHGYGHLRYQNKFMTASRVAFLMAGGILEKGMVVRHTCDNPPCCNPNHLIRGTQKDNGLDAVQRGRLPIGSRRPQAKLNEDIVKAILSDHRKQSEIAASYNVDPALISRIKNRKRWKHVN